MASVSLTYDIDLTSDWTTLWIDSKETLSNVLCSRIYDGGAGTVTVTWAYNQIHLGKSTVNTARVEYSCAATLSGLETGDSYVDYRINKGDIGSTTVKILAGGYWIASRTDGWDVPGNAENDLKFSVPDVAHSTGNLQRTMLYSISTTSDWTKILLKSEESFSGAFYTITRGSGTPALSVGSTTSTLEIWKNPYDQTQIDVLFQVTLNHLKVGDAAATDGNSVKYEIQKGDIGQTHLWIYAPGNGLSRTLIQDRIDSTSGPSPNSLIFNVLDNRHIFWDSIVTTFFYPWFDNPNTPHQGGAWNAWDQDNHNPANGQWAAHYMPDFVDSFDVNTNLYDSGNTQVIRWQLTEMKKAGIELAVASWWGQTHWTDDNLHKIMNYMASPDNPYPALKWTIYYEPWHGWADASPGLSAPPTADQIKADIEYIVNTFGSSPSFARIDGKPVIFLYQAPCDGQVLVDSFYGAKQKLIADGYSVFFSADVKWQCYFGEYNGHTPLYTYDSLHLYYPALRGDCLNTYMTDSPDGDTCYVSPGYWKWDNTLDQVPGLDPRECVSITPPDCYLARDSSAYESKLRDNVNGILASPNYPRILLVETWNEWGEGTSIEPGREINHKEGTDPFTDGCNVYCLSVPGPDFNEAFVTSTWNQVSRFKVFAYPVPTAPGAPAWASGDEKDGVFTLSWSAPNSYAGIWSYELQQQFNGGTWVSLSSTVSGTSYPVTVSTAGPYAYRVRAKDYTGNVGPFSGTASLVAGYRLTVSVAAGAGTTSPSGTNYYFVGRVVSVQATPSNGYAFDHWVLDSTTYTTNPLSVTMNADHTLSASFRTASGYTLTISSTPLGTTSPAAGTYTYSPGTKVSVSASPYVCKKFSKWYLDGTRSTSNPIVVTMDKSHSLQPVFTVIRHCGPKSGTSPIGDAWPVQAGVMVGRLGGGARPLLSPPRLQWTSDVTTDRSPFEDPYRSRAEVLARPLMGGPHT